MSVSIGPRLDEKIANFLEAYGRRVEATPPGPCPLALADEGDYAGAINMERKA